MTTTTTPTSGMAIQRYKIGYHADEWGQRSSTPSGIPDASGSWVRYADHVTALAAGQATAAQAVVPARDLAAVIKGAADKLDAAVCCHPNAVDTLIHEALEILDGDREPDATPASRGQAPSVEREQERIAFKDAHRHLELYEVPDAWGRPMFKHSHVEASWLGWIARASHGQAPAGTTEPTEQQILEAAEKAGLWPNTVHSWIPAFHRYHKELAKAQPAPAQAAEPVAVVVPCYTPSGKRVALYSAKQDLPIGTKLYAAPQPSPTAPATQQPEGDVVAYLDVGANGYLDLGSELSEDALQQLPKGRHALVIAGTYGIDGYVAAPQPSYTAQAADSVQEDAARYRWLREGNDAKHGAAWYVAVNLYGCEWDAAIDAARKQGASHDNS